MSGREDFERDYYESRGFDREHTRKVRSHYLKFVEGREFLVELGCGRGEFLEDAAARVGRALGVDRDPGMVAEAKGRGLEVVEEEAIEYLRTTNDRPDAIFAAHLIEHLDADAAFQMLEAAARILRPAGIIVLVTPNPECLSIMLSDFWSDPTHARLYTLPLLEFLLKQAGFAIKESGANPLDEPGPPPELIVSDTLAQWHPIRPDPPEGWPDFRGRWSTEELRGEVGRLRARIDALTHIVYTLAERTAEQLGQVRHQAHVATEGVNRALRHLYGPNEIYAVGERSP